MAYRVMAFFIPLMVIIMAIIFLRKPPRLSISTHAGQETYQTLIKDPYMVDLKCASRSWTLRQAILTKQFWIPSVSFFFNSLINQSILAHHAAFFVDKGLETLFVSYIVGMIGLVSIVGKILWGPLSDRIGREVTYTLIMFCFICGILLLITFPILSSLYIPYFFAIFFGMGYAGVAVLPALITADFFPGRAYGSIFGTIFILNSVGGAFGAWFCGFLYDQVGNYIPFFIIVMVCAGLACFNIWVAAPRKIRIIPREKVSKVKRNPTSKNTII